MPLRKEVFIQNGHYHIYNRGHNKQNIFLSPKDYLRYLQRLKDYLKKHPVSLLVYCLMPNHIHLVLRQDDNESIKQFMHRLHTSYTMYFNKKYERVGAVFQGRFKAKMIETDEYLLHVSRYIHQNPLEILPAQDPALRLEKYPWSSYKEYISEGKEKLNRQLCKTDVILSFFVQNTNDNQKLTYRYFVGARLKKLNQSLLKNISAGDIPESSTLKAGP